MGLLIQKKDIEYVNAVDVFKLLFSLCIVGIHTSVLSAFSGDVEWYVMHLVFRLAVPYFFIASAFFYGVKIYRDENNKEHRRSVCRDYIRRNIYYFLFWGGHRLNILYIINGAWWRKNCFHCIKNNTDCCFLSEGCHVVFGSMLFGCGSYYKVVGI